AADAVGSSCRDRGNPCRDPIALCPRWLGPPGRRHLLVAKSLRYLVPDLQILHSRYFIRIALQHQAAPGPFTAMTLRAVAAQQRGNVFGEGGLFDNWLDWCFAGGIAGRKEGSAHQGQQACCHNTRVLPHQVMLREEISWLW